MGKRCDEELLNEFKIRFHNYIIAETKKKDCLLTPEVYAFFEVVVLKVLQDMGYNDYEFMIDISSHHLINVYAHFLGTVGCDRICSIRLVHIGKRLSFQDIVMVGTDCFSKEKFSHLKESAWTLDKAIKQIESECGGRIDDVFR